MKTTIRTATLGIAEEFRKMKVGDVVHFPLDKYNYNSIRTTPSTTLIKERMDGHSWKQKIDFDNKCVAVTRTA